jgi:hypothetical protein
MSAILAIVGFGATVLLVGLAMVNNVSPVIAVAGLSPFWVMAILATIVLKRTQP